MTKVGSYIGIDPGLSGAIAAITAYEDYSDIEVIPMPIIEVKSGTKAKDELDIGAIALFLKNQPFVHMVALEKVHAMPISGGEKCPKCKRKPSQGVVSSFRFGESYGALKGVLSALGLPFILVAPQTWKAEILKDLPWKGNKKASITYCQSRHPKVSLLPKPKSRVPNDGMADALCIARYAIKEGNF